MFEIGDTVTVLMPETGEELEKRMGQPPFWVPSMGTMRDRYEVKSINSSGWIILRNEGGLDFSFRSDWVELAGKVLFEI